MCDNVLFHDRGGRTASNQGDLAQIIGTNSIVMEENAIFNEEDCLCPVNLTATAEGAGYEQSRLDADGEHDAFDYHWRKK